jgi:hypothetical protein
MKVLKAYRFVVEYIDDKENKKRRIDTEFSTYLAGAVRKWQQNHDNATIVGILEA